MKVLRLSRVVDVVRLWPFFTEGFNANGVRAREEVDLIFAQKTLYALVVDHISAWIAVSYDETGDPVAFAVLQECTPPFSTTRRFVVRWFFHSNDNFLATKTLMDAFETWAREQGIVSYAVTTKRDSGAAIRCFQSNKFGFVKSHVTFEKVL
jgi:hypothetical protein